MVLFVPHQLYQYDTVKKCSLEFIANLEPGQVARTVTFFTNGTCSITNRPQKEHTDVDSAILNLNNLLHALETYGKEQNEDEARTFLQVVQRFDVCLRNFMHEDDKKPHGEWAKRMSTYILKGLPDKPDEPKPKDVVVTPSGQSFLRLL